MICRNRHAAKFTLRRVTLVFVGASFPSFSHLALKKRSHRRRPRCQIPQNLVLHPDAPRRTAQIHFLINRPLNTVYTFNHSITTSPPLMTVSARFNHLLYDELMYYFELFCDIKLCLVFCALCFEIMVPLVYSPKNTQGQI